MIKDAHATIYSAEKQVLAVNESDTRHFTNVQRVRSRLEALRELVVAEPEQSQKIKSAMEEVRIVSKPMRVWGDSWGWRLLCLLNLCVLTMVVWAQASQDFEDKLKRDGSREGEVSASK